MQQVLYFVCLGRVGVYVLVVLFIWKVTPKLIAGAYIDFIQLLYRVYISYCMPNAVVDHYLPVIVLTLYVSQFQLFYT